MREISHSLNTPLSQIEIALSLIEGGPSLSSDDNEALARAITSVALCKAYIQAFRLVAGGEMAPVGSVEQSLNELVSRAVSAASSDGVEVDVRLPEDIGYGSAFILTMLMPLIENAVEASDRNGLVEVWADGDDSSITLNVRNTAPEPLSSDMYRPGVSTKQDHEGLGLAIVQRLVGSIPGASLRDYAQEGAVTFSVLLPARA